jgi:KUP system potassium uptake protein
VPSSGNSRALLPVTLTAIGVVYGDIGTSPLYAMRECFFGSHSVMPTHDNVLGVLSLIVYSLVLVISVKYIAIVLRADNQGEGGILALTALIPGGTGGTRTVLVLLGIFGAALLYGDGMITPAVTVLGAVEGLKVSAGLSERSLVPIAVVILLVVFAIQRHGTHRVGRMFGPIMVGWFAVLALLGIVWVTRYPDVLAAINPWQGIRFLIENRGHGFAVLGAVFLVVTGGEALYADMGHFGARPIRVAWFAVVLPALLLNYFGQGALLLHRPETRDPFFELSPQWAQLPLVVLATAAAIIASQALISGAFSLTRQAIQLGYAPRLTVEHTSSWEMGQIYVPQVNWFLAICTILIVVQFRSSSALAAAYGIAVTMTMIITALLLHVIAVEPWRWPRPAALAVTTTFLVIDLSFFSANLLKVFQGGWLPIAIGALLFTLMTTWKTGRRIVAERLVARAFPLEAFVTAVRTAPQTRVPGTAVFMTAQPTGTPAALVHNLRYNKMLHEHVIVLTVATVPTPHVSSDQRLTVQTMGANIFNARIQYGFMEDPDVPEVLDRLREVGVPIDRNDLTFFLGRETIVVGQRKGMAVWREKLFVLMARNAVRATAFFKLPPERVVELGVQVEM